MQFYKKKDKNKRGAVPGMGILMFVAAIVGIVAIAGFLLGKVQFGNTALTVAPNQPSSSVAAANNAGVASGLTFTEDTTVTFSSQDAYAAGTNAGTGHFIVMLGADKSIQVNDDSTRTASPNDQYTVLIGNVTTSITAGTGYYPVWVTGTIPDKGTHTINAGQYLSGGAAQLTFTFFNANEQVNTAENMGANDQATVEWKLTANDNVCIGNPSAGGDNLMNYRYNTTLYSEVTQLDSSSNPQTAISTPVGVSSLTGTALRSYTFPVVCDNADVKRKVLVKTLGTAPDSSSDEINMTVSDISIDYDTDTLAKIVGYTDEDNNDIGVADFLVAGVDIE